MTDYIVANCEIEKFNGLYEYDDRTYGFTIPDETEAWAKWDGNGHTFPDNFIAIILSDISATSNPVIGDLYGISFLNDPNISSPYLIQPDDPSIVWYFADGITPSALTVTAASSGTVDETYLLSAQYFGKFYWPNNAVPEVADADTTDELTSTNVESASSVSKPTITQVHVLASTNVESGSNVGKTESYPDIIVSGVGAPVEYVNGTYEYFGLNNGRPEWQAPLDGWNGAVYWAGGSYGWMITTAGGGTEFYSTDDVATPDLVTTWIDGGYGAASLPTVTAASGNPTLGQVHVLTSQAVTAESSASKPTLSESNALTSSDVTSESSVSKPTIAQVHALTSTNVEAGSSVSEPTIGQTHALISRNVTSESGVSQSSMGGEVNLTSSNVESASSVSKPTLGQAHVLTSQSVTAESSVSKPSISGEIALTSTNVTAASEVSKPTLAEGSFALTSSNVEVGSSVSKPTLGQVHNLTSQNVTSESSVSKPTLVLVIALTSQNVEAGSSVSKPTLTSADFLFAEIWDGSVVINVVIAEDVVLNKEVNAGVIMNQEITDTYSELEAI